MCFMILKMMGRDDLTRVTFGAAILSVTLLLAGCVQKPVEKDDVAMVTTDEQLRSAPTQPALPPAKAEEPKTQKKTAAKTPDPAAEAPAAPAPVYSATELVGKNPSEVAALIGNPAQVEQRAASTVWTYRGDSCGLDVFFFLDMATSDERVLTVESRADAVDPAAAAAAPAATTGTAAAAPAGTVASTSAAPAATATAETAIAPAPGEITSDAGSGVDACYGKLRRS